MGDKCKLMRPKATRVRDKCGRQGGDKCKLMPPKEPRVGDKGETSVGDNCGRQVWEASVGDKWETHAAQGTQSERQVWEARGRQV